MYHIHVKRVGCWLPIAERGMPVTMTRQFATIEDARQEKARLEAEGEIARITDRTGMPVEES